MLWSFQIEPKGETHNKKGKWVQKQCLVEAPFPWTPSLDMPKKHPRTIRKQCKLHQDPPKEAAKTSRIITKWNSYTLTSKYLEPPGTPDSPWIPTRGRKGVTPYSTIESFIRPSKDSPTLDLLWIPWSPWISTIIWIQRILRIQIERLGIQLDKNFG